ncbi:MAG: response regulator [Actinomycetota bacterium]
MTDPLILVVSDDPVVQDEVCFGFPSDIEVKAANDAREAWKVMEDQLPSVAVIEIRTGSAGGFGLARDMSQRKDLQDIPILMLLERAQDRWLAKTAGACAVLVQPIETGALVTDTLALLPTDAVA